MCIAAILVGHEKFIKMVKTYAMLDNCNQGFFIKEEITEERGITGSKTEVKPKDIDW